MEALQRQDAQEDSSTMVLLTMYLLALDEQYDHQALELRSCLHRVEEAEIFNWMLQVCSSSKRMLVLQLLRAGRLPCRKP